MTKEKVFFHVDLDAFFASVEQLDNPEYRGKPVIVGGTSKRGVVSTCSYEARKFGVHSAMPIMRAKKLCPNGIFVNGRMSRYHEKSKEVMKIFSDFSPEIRQLSIDEAFLNMTGMEKLLGPPEETAKLLKERVKKETGLTISLGCATSRYVAKIASDKSKPNGLLIIPAGKEIDFIHQLPLKDIWGIGEKMREKLINAGLTSVPQIFNTDERILCSILGNAAGSFLYKAVRAELTNIFSEEAKSHSISTERTFVEDILSHSQIDDILFHLSNELMFRILDGNVQSKTVGVKIRYNDFKTVSIQSSEGLINDNQDLYQRVKKLFYQKFDNRTPIRLIGISIMNIKINTENIQTELFCDEQKIKKQKIEKTMYELSKKEGKNILKPARLLNDKD